MPSTVQVTCGAVKLELAKHLFWNLNGIWYEGTQVCRQGKGFYGTAVAFSGLGWIGTGHLENKIGEKEGKVSSLLDGREWQPGAMPAKGKSFTMKKSAFVSRVTAEKPIAGKDEWSLWNRGSDRIYYVPVRTATLKSGNSYEWSMTAGFFTVPPDQWKKKAAAPEQK